MIYDYEDANPKVCPRCGNGDGRGKRTLSTKTLPDGPVDRYRKCMKCEGAGWNTIEVRRDLWDTVLARIAELEAQNEALRSADVAETILHMKHALSSLSPVYAADQEEKSRQRRKEARRGQPGSTRRSRDVART